MIHERFMVTGRKGKERHLHKGFLRIQEVGEPGDNEFRYSIYCSHGRIDVDPNTISPVAVKPKDGGLDWKCPNCNKVLASYDYNYCPNCGQRIDWQVD